MEVAVSMRTISRVLVFVASAVLWLVLLVILNRALLHTGDFIIIMAALAAGLLQTVALVLFLRL